MPPAAAPPPPEPPPSGIGALLGDPEIRIVVCCGAGGVGKTTTAAALAVHAAEQGRTVVVLTIDPARRLAQALGLRELDNTPREVAGVDTTAGGRLDAMMLDMKRTFDEIVLAHSTPERAEQIFANPFYQSLSSSFAGTQEYMAMEKLGQLQGSGRWDLVVVDTPPSRSALDFLDAPSRLGSFLDGRFIKVLTAPAKAGGRAYLKVVGAGMSAVTGVVAKVLGAQVLADVQGFVAAMDTMFGGFRERAEQTYAMLTAPGTAFLVVATPERDALREASYFVDRLERDGMPVHALVLNRVHTGAVRGLSPEQAVAAAERLTDAPDDDTDDNTDNTDNTDDTDDSDDTGRATDATTERAPDGATGDAAEAGTAPQPPAPLTATLLRLYAERASLAARERHLAERFTRAHPSVPVARVPARAADVHDLEDLRTVAADLVGTAVTRRRAGDEPAVR